MNFPFKSSIFALIVKLVFVPDIFDALILNVKSDELSNKVFESMKLTA